MQRCLVEYKVPFVNYPLQYQMIKAEIDTKIQNLLSRGELYLREETQKFEQDFAKFVGCKYGISVNSCTDAMFLSIYGIFESCGRRGTHRLGKIVTVSHTYVSTISSILNNDFGVILADVDANDYNIDVETLEDTINRKESISPTIGILPVHLNGRCCNMDIIMKIAKEHNLVVIEDSAQAVGAMYDGKKAGSFGDTGCFSFYPAKILGSYGDAGIITTNNKELAMRLYDLRDNGEKPKYMMTQNELKYRYIQEFGFMSVMDNIQAGVLNIKMKYLPKWIKERREIADWYLEMLIDDPFIDLPYAPDDKEYFDVYQNYVIRVKNRDKVQKQLEEKGIETMVSWRIPNHKQPKLMRLHQFNLPVTERISKEVLSLPMYPELLFDQVKYVCDILKQVVR